MSRGDPRRARVLGVWTAGWMAAFLLAGVLRLGDISVQWPVFAVPLLWALVALRPRRRPAWEIQRDDGRDHDDRDHDGWDDGGWDEAGWDEGRWDDDRWADEEPPAAQNRTDTVERPVVRRPADDDDPWGRRR